MPRGTASRRRTGPRTRVPLEPSSTRSPSATPRRSASARRELDDLLRAQELQRRRDVDLLGAPQRAVGAEPQRALRGPRRARAARDLQRRPAPTARPRSCAAASRSGQRTPRPPISSSVRPGVERDGLEQLPRRDRAGRDAEVVPGARGDVGDDLPAGAHAAARPGALGAADRGAQALQAAVGVHERALLLGVGLGREDDVGVLAHGLGQHRLVGDHGLRGAERLPPTARGRDACAAGRRAAGRAWRARRRRGPGRSRSAPRAGLGERRVAGRRGRRRSRPRAGRGRSCWRGSRAGPAPSRPARPSRDARLSSARAATSPPGPASRRSP